MRYQNGVSPRRNLVCPSLRYLKDALQIFIIYCLVLFVFFLLIFYINVFLILHIVMILLCGTFIVITRSCVDG